MPYGCLQERMKFRSLQLAEAYLTQMKLLMSLVLGAGVAGTRRSEVGAIGSFEFESIGFIEIGGHTRGTKHSRRQPRRWEKRELDLNLRR
jgi:hypothetical protein